MNSEKNSNYIPKEHKPIGLYSGDRLFPVTLEPNSHT